MAATYKRLYGADWPVEMTDQSIGITIGKKWREFDAKYGTRVFSDPWVPYVDALRSLFGDAFKVSEWAEAIVHDWVMNEDGSVLWGCASCGKSYVTGFLAVTDWILDPYDTTTLVGSTTKDALRIRTWASVETSFAMLKSLGRQLGFDVPGKITQTGYQIINDREGDDDPLAQSAKAGIHGVALNDGGKLQGAHSKYVRLIIDELATINNHSGEGGIIETINNLQVAPDFKFVALANPSSWASESSQYCVPVDGIASVNVDTESWVSTFGYHVRHFDGLKSPCILHPELAERFPYLTQAKHVEKALRLANGNPDAPYFWKMVRGFPTPAGSDVPVVLDEATAVRNRVTDPAPPFDPATLVATAAGIDPAWSEGGDGACRARCYVRRDDFGKPYLDFTGGLRRMTLNASEFKTHPAVEQLRNQVIAAMRQPYEAPFRNTAVDSSGNQGLASDLTIYAGAYDIMSVDNSVRASEEPLRAFDRFPAKDVVYDRGTEAWCVLAEFCRAGMVRGLPAEALRALTTRPFATRKNDVEPVRPLRLQPKRDFRLQFKHSPDECDACALAALAVKEAVGLVPFGHLPAPVPQNTLLQSAPSGPRLTVVSRSASDGFDRPAVDGDGELGPLPV